MRNTMLTGLCFVMLTAAGCATNPVTGRSEFMLLHPTMEEQKVIGREYAPQVQQELGGEIQDPVIQQYIGQVGAKIAAASHRPDLEFQFTAVESEQVNALALPGGYIFITRGMLQTLETEDQLAAVLAHEAAHVTAEHSASMIARQMGINLVLSAVLSEKTPDTAVKVASFAGQMIQLRYSREFEKESDELGTDYLVKAGYNPYGMVEVMRHLDQLSSNRQLEFLSTHPNPENRLALIETHIQQKGYSFIKTTPTNSYSTIKSRL